MANDNNKNQELASTDEDPTAELEALPLRDSMAGPNPVVRESDAGTFDFTDLGSRKDAGPSSLPMLREEIDEQARTIGKLQFELGQLQAKSRGLEAELDARSAIIDDLQMTVESLESRIDRKQGLLRKRAMSIKALKREIRDRELRQRELTAIVDTLRESAVREQRLPEVQPATAASCAENAAPDSTPATQDEPRGIPVTEEYADSLRRKLQDMMRLHAAGEKERRMLRADLEARANSEARIQSQLDGAQREIERLGTQIEADAGAHAEEIRILRFELGEAQDTVVQTEELNVQLAADLMSTRGFKEELERMLCNTDEQSRQRIDTLEKQIQELTQMRDRFEQKLEAKSQAITALLDELAKKTELLDSASKIDAVVSKIDQQLNDRLTGGTENPKRAPRLAPGDRVTRMLVGTIDNQEVRFPLFKNRLTIGRTSNNDIQLRADWVSRRHAVVITEQDMTRVIDWGSKNGVYVNSRRIKEHFLSNGDVVTIGNARFRYEERVKKDN